MKQFALILMFIGYHICPGQTNNSFTLSGSINADSGYVELFPLGNESHYPKELIYSKIPVSNRKFHIEGKIDYPVGVLIGLRGSNQDYISGTFFIEPGNQNITCNVDSLRETPGIQNATMREYLQQFLPVCQSIDTVNDYYKRNKLQRQYILGYAQKNPDSWVALWEISRRLSSGYDLNLDSAYHTLSDKVKRSESGKTIGVDLKQLALTDTGKIFPNINVIDTSGRSHKMDYSVKNPKYILIDFWFSHCDACIGEFPEYLTILSKYRSKGFRMIGVSSDSSPANIEAWKKVIRSKSLNWVQYRTDQNTMNNLRIFIAPYNFLLDGSGKIVAKDLGTKEVSDFLQANLN